MRFSSYGGDHKLTRDDGLSIRWKNSGPRKNDLVMCKSELILGSFTVSAQNADDRRERALAELEAMTPDKLAGIVNEKTRQHEQVIAQKENDIAIRKANIAKLQRMARDLDLSRVRLLGVTQ